MNWDDTDEALDTLRVSFDYLHDTKPSAKDIPAMKIWNEKHRLVEKEAIRIGSIRFALVDEAKKLR